MQRQITLKFPLLASRGVLLALGAYLFLFKESEKQTYKIIMAI